MKKLISLLICIAAIYIVTIPKDLGAQALRVLLPVQGGTGISTSSPTDIGKCIKVLSDSPFKYELASCGGLGSDPTIIQVDGTPQSVGTPTLNFTGNSFSLTESPADTFSIRVSTSTLGLLASSISDFVSTVRTSISETIEGLTYTSGTGVLSLDSGYTIPTTTRAVNWDTAFGWGNHASQGYITDGNTNWDNSYNFVTQGQTVGTTTAGVVGQIPYWTGIRTLGTVATTSLTASGALSLSQPISVIGSSASALTCLTASGSQAGCLTSTDWNTFNNKQATLSVTHPILLSGNTLSLAFSTTTANTWSQLQTFGYASSTGISGTNLTFTNATTTNIYSALASTTLFYGALLAQCNGAQQALTWNNGQFGCATITGTGDGVSNWKLNSGGDALIASSTKGLVALASSTIGGGTGATGLTILGGATTTGNHIITGSATSSTSFFSALGTFTNLFGTNANITYASTTGISGTNANFTNATTTNLRVSNTLSFGGVSGTAWSTFCTSITGGSGLCDGVDDGGSASPGASDSYFQYNNGGTFAGASTTHNALRFIEGDESVLVGTTSQSAARLEVGNQDSTFSSDMIRIISNGSSGGNADVHISSPDADIEFCNETGGTAPAGCFEINALASNNQMYFTPRNAANSSYADPLITLNRDASTAVGTVGIGTRYDTPGAMLEIAGTSTITKLLAITDTFGGTDGNRMLVTRTGFVGIGETNPDVLLHIATTSGSATHDFIKLENSGAFAEGGAGIRFQNSAGSIDMARLYARPGSSYTDASLAFSVADSAKTLTERMRIDVNGFVGIGSTTPGFMLTVTGTSSLATTTQASSTIGTLTVSGNTVLASASSTNLFATLGTFTNLVVNTLATFLNVVVTGLLDVGGGVLEIPNGTAPVIDSIGEIGLDSTDDQLIMADGGGTARVFGTDEFRVVSLTMASSSLQFDSGDLLAVLGNKDGLEITQFRCYVVGGTSKVVNLTDGTNDTETITCGTTMTSDTDVATNDTFTADEIGSLEMGATTGVVNYLHFEAWGRITRE